MSVKNDEAFEINHDNIDNCVKWSSLFRSIIESKRSKKSRKKLKEKMAKLGHSGVLVSEIEALLQGNMRVLKTNVQVREFVTRVMLFFRGDKKSIPLSLLIRQFLLFDEVISNPSLRKAVLDGTEQEESVYEVELIKNLGNISDDEALLLKNLTDGQCSND